MRLLLETSAYPLFKTEEHNRGYSVSTYLPAGAARVRTRQDSYRLVHPGAVLQKLREVLYGALQAAEVFTAVVHYAAHLEHIVSIPPRSPRSPRSSPIALTGRYIVLRGW